MPYVPRAVRVVSRVSSTLTLRAPMLQVFRTVSALVAYVPSS